MSKQKNPWKKALARIVWLAPTLGVATAAVLLILFSIADPSQGQTISDTQSDSPRRDGASQQTVLQTALFALGEVGLSTLGVSATELLGVGPQLSLQSSGDDGMLIVDDDGLDCPNFQYMTIQAAVNDAMPGDKIKVCPGTYMEQVTIPATGKDGLTLFAEAAFQAVIKAPIVMSDVKAIVRVNGAQNVTIRHFTI